MEQYDVIIIGAGLSGLTAGALLADSGKKVLVLEKEYFVGGRACGTTYQGHAMDNGLHTPSAMGHLEELFKRFGKEWPAKPEFFKDIEVFYDSKWQSFMEILDRKELRKLLGEITSYTYEQIEQFEDVSLKDWLTERTDSEAIHLYFYCFAAGGMASNRYERFSAAELFFFLKEHMEATGKIGGFFYFCHGGVRKLADGLHEALIERGGEVRTNSKVTNIVVENGKVCGVEIEKGQKIVPIQWLPTEVIKAPVVICTLPLWNLFNVVNQDILPSWYVERLEANKHKVRTIWYITCGVDGKLDSWPDEWAMKWAQPDDSKTGVQFCCTYCPGYAPQGQYQIAFTWQGDQDEVPNIFSLDKAQTQQQVKQFFDLCEQDLKAWFPDLDKHLLWKTYTVSPMGQSFLPGIRSGRPYMDVPGVENLYLVSDTVRENKGDGMQSVARTAKICVERILKKD